MGVAIVFCGDEIGGGDHFGRVNFLGMAIAFYLWVRGDLVITNFVKAIAFYRVGKGRSRYN
ncbi:MAG: hypothetical protein KA717_17065 [Woronichinia naegeliana WA131]|uniref:Uncharacterized protein n=1 Tax=Woronichinia naegeliana WA131 TaxID=2824559 RepID=A0A977Q040_9CYAN|nr:MAG: hypothetical protein KA717_17065 [Woronichinia naegeliana WA131]